MALVGSCWLLLTVVADDNFWLLLTLVVVAAGHHHHHLQAAACKRQQATKVMAGAPFSRHARACFAFVLQIAEKAKTKKRKTLQIHNVFTGNAALGYHYFE